jgi:pseudaminic acid synthase
MKPRPLTIGGKSIQAGSLPLLVAEVSGNHLGRFDRALGIVRAAASSGASAIKLQTFTPASLTVDSGRSEFFIDDRQSPWYGRRLWELYEEAHTPWEWHEQLFAVARGMGLACLSSAFDEESVTFLAKLKVDAIKIASFELIHIPLLRVAARSGLPLILSTGMANRDEIDEAVETIRAAGCEQFALLKCTSAYPAEERESNIRTMIDMRNRYVCHVGLSDHTRRPYAAFAAAAHGAAVIETHLTLNRSDGGPDADFSLEPHEFSTLALGLEKVWESLGGAVYGVSSGEETSLKERPSIYIVAPVKAGEPLTTNNTRIIRPAGGLLPKHYGEIMGRACARDVDDVTPLTWDLVGEI